LNAKYGLSLWCLTPLSTIFLWLQLNILKYGITLDVILVCIETDGYCFKLSQKQSIFQYFI